MPGGCIHVCTKSSSEDKRILAGLTPELGGGLECIRGVLEKATVEHLTKKMKAVLGRQDQQVTARRAVHGVP